MELSNHFIVPRKYDMIGLFALIDEVGLWLYFAELQSRCLRELIYFNEWISCDSFRLWIDIHYLYIKKA